MRYPDRTGIVHYGAGNLFSLTAALDRIGAKYDVLTDPKELTNYGRIIIPGVGHAGTAMDRLRQSGMAEQIPSLQVPVLGICVGMQLLTGFSEEGDSNLLGIVPLQTLHFTSRIEDKVPHMGWNRVHVDKNSALFADVDKDAYFYFVHSFYVPYESDYTIAHTNYGLRFSAAIKRGNFYGVQFHPEKSGAAGEQLLANFTQLIV